VGDVSKITTFEGLSGVIKITTIEGLSGVIEGL
jgi:hypothetical protein